MAKQMNAQSQFDRVTEITKQLEEGIQTLFESEKFKTWLTTMSRFHDYSLNNTLRFPQLKEINGLFAFLLHFADKTVVDFNLLGAGVAFVFYGFMDDNLLDQGIQQFGSQF